ncbi:MAG TPA: TonB family protein [Candidatus Sulfotelmatobacter sp.]|nr:TonB family protein [Candidatus Sulfotelmatobacter sp.]
MAYVRANLFYEREKWSKPLLVSLAFHAALVLGGFVLGFVMNRHSSANDWGIKEGDAVTAQLVSASIPIPHAEQSENIVANESKGVTQTQPQPKPVETEDGISISGKVKPKPIEKPPVQTARVQPPPRPIPTPVDTAVPYGEGGPVSGPYGSVVTSNYKGGFSFRNADFGGKYGWYVDAVKRRVQQNWLTYEIDPRIKAPHRAFIEFDIQRDGSPSNVHLAQSSGVPSLDQSAMRAIQRIDSFGKLPEGNSVTVEFWFDYPPK